MIMIIIVLVVIFVGLFIKVKIDPNFFVSNPDDF
jgi:hypothetical protein